MVSISGSLIYDCSLIPLSNNCSEVPIVKALKKGVRDIELDLWPNLSKNKVDVHGKP